jgi:hypothetical protein
MSAPVAYRIGPPGFGQLFPVDEDVGEASGIVEIDLAAGHPIGEHIVINARLSGPHWVVRQVRHVEWSQHDGTFIEQRRKPLEWYGIGLLDGGFIEGKPSSPRAWVIPLSGGISSPKKVRPFGMMVAPRPTAESASIRRGDTCSSIELSSIAVQFA